MPQFLPRRTQPPRPDTYLRLARLARGYLDTIEATAHATEPQDKRRRTMALTALMIKSRDLWARNGDHG